MRQSSRLAGALARIGLHKRLGEIGKNVIRVFLRLQQMTSASDVPHTSKPLSAKHACRFRGCRAVRKNSDARAAAARVDACFFFDGSAAGVYSSRRGRALLWPSQSIRSRAELHFGDNSQKQMKCRHVRIEAQQNFCTIG
jgi:hypothetical protein